MNIRVKIIFLLLSLVVFITACSGNDDKQKKAENNNVTIVASFFTIYDFTKQIVKDKADVELFVPAHISPHHWEPAPKDLKKVQQADLFIYSSEHFETWIGQIEKSMQNHGTQFVKASECIELVEGEETGDHNHHEHQFDPHVWLSPVLAQKLVENIADAIIEIDPDNAEYYEKNRDAYLEQLEQLHNEYQDTLKQMNKNTFVTEHAAFGYLAREYDLHEVSIAGLSPSLEPSASQLAKLKQFVQQEQIHVIYVDELSNAELAHTLANEAGVEIETLSTLEGLTKKQQEQGMNYIEMMKQNLKALEKSFK